MSELLLNIINAFGNLLSLWTIFLIAIGVLAGILVGAIPGLGGGILMAVMLPLTFHMQSLDAQATLIGIYLGSVSGGMISAVMIGIPGQPSSVPTLFDGYTLAQKGQPARALALGAFASFFGGLVSWVILATLSLPLASIAIKFNYFEYFSMVVCGFALISSFAGDSLLKSGISAFCGILAASVGLDPIGGTERLTFGFLDLQMGFQMFAVLLGLYAVGQMLGDIEEMSKPKKIMKVNIMEVLKSLRNMGRHWWNLLRSSLLGSWIGILPGVGALLGSMVAYSVAKNTSKTPEKFGQGTEEGIIASESGNNATVGGALVPMIALGIPGSPADVLLMAALIIHNIQPGPLLLVEHPDTFYGIICAMFMANTIMLILLLPLTVWLGKVLEIRTHYLVPVVLLFSMVGIFAMNNRMQDVWVMLGFGVFGLLLRYGGIPLAPFIICLILAPVAEENLRSAVTFSDGSLLPLITQPLSLFFLVLALLALLWPFWKQYRKKRAIS